MMSKIYYVENNAGCWFVCPADDKRKARSEGVVEFGRGWTNAVREATDDEIARYKLEKSIQDIQDL